jgi:hypothetical protein
VEPGTRTHNATPTIGFSSDLAMYFLKIQRFKPFPGRIYYDSGGVRILIRKVQLEWPVSPGPSKCWVGNRWQARWQKKQGSLAYLMFSCRKKTFNLKKPEANKIRRRFYDAYIWFLHFIWQKNREFYDEKKSGPLLPNATRIRVKQKSCNPPPPMTLIN